MISQAEKDNIMRWEGRRGHYEVYYIKFNHRSSQTGYWLRYSLLSPLQGEVLAEVWGIFFDPQNPNRNLALKETFPISEVQFSRERFYFRIGASSLFHTGAKGELKKYGDSLRWDLKFDSLHPPRMGQETFHHFPHNIMYQASLPKTKVLSPNFDIRVSGRIEVNGQAYECQGEPGQQTHIWGTKHAERWTWGHCNVFIEDPSGIFEGLSAQIKIGGWITPPLSPIYIRWNGQEYFMNGLIRCLRNASNTELPMWKFETKTGSLTFSGEMKARVEDFVGVEYTDPDGEKLWCNNTKVADLAITILNKGEKIGTLTSNKAAAFEVVTRAKDPRIPIRI